MSDNANWKETLIENIQAEKAKAAKDNQEIVNYQLEAVQYAANVVTPALKEAQNLFLSQGYRAEMIPTETDKAPYIIDLSVTNQNGSGVFGYRFQVEARETGVVISSSQFSPTRDGWKILPGPMSDYKNFTADSIGMDIQKRFAASYKC